VPVSRLSVREICAAERSAAAGQQVRRPAAVSEGVVRLSPPDDVAYLMGAASRCCFLEKENPLARERKVRGFKPPGGKVHRDKREKERDGRRSTKSGTPSAARRRNAWGQDRRRLLLEDDALPRQNLEHATS